MNVKISPLWPEGCCGITPYLLQGCEVLPQWAFWESEIGKKHKVAHLEVFSMSVISGLHPGLELGGTGALLDCSLASLKV